MTNSSHLNLVVIKYISVNKISCTFDPIHTKKSLLPHFSPRETAVYNLTTSQTLISFYLLFSVCYFFTVRSLAFEWRLKLVLIKV